MRTHSAAIDWSKVSIEELQKNPKKFGLPTFAEYCKNRAQWNPSVRSDQGMITLTDGPQKFRKDLLKIKFQVHGKTMPEEQIEVALGDHGYSLEDVNDCISNRNSRLKKDIQMMPQGGGKFELVVNFLP